mmetsp:Transcript_48169/g.113206  ORF Transcript_48169/g.113206 Transcript_48169/m.113206 type:complete len:89 (-) Transcript_48169:331-597(-)
MIGVLLIVLHISVIGVSVLIAVLFVRRCWGTLTDKIKRHRYRKKTLQKAFQTRKVSGNALGCKCGLVSGVYHDRSAHTRLSMATSHGF